MSNKSQLQENNIKLSDILDVINNLDTVPPPFEVVNGTIEEYVSETEDIEPYTFIEFVNSLPGVTGTPLSAPSVDAGVITNGYICIDFAQYDDNTIVVAQDESAYVLKIVDGVLTQGATLALSDNPNGYEPNIIITESKNIYIIRGYTVDRLSLNNLTLTLISSFSLNDRLYVCEYLGNNKIIGVNGNSPISSSYNYHYVYIYTISGNSFIQNTKLEYENVWDGPALPVSGISLTPSKTKAFLMSDHDTYPDYHYINISGNTITILGEPGRRVNNNKPLNIRFASVSETNAVIFCGVFGNVEYSYLTYDSSTNKVNEANNSELGADIGSNEACVNVITINNGENIVLSLSTGSLVYVYLYSYANSPYLTLLKYIGVQCSSSPERTATFFVPNNYLIVNGMQSYSNANNLINLNRWNKGIKKSSTKIEGITKTKSTTNELGEVYVLSQ